MRNSSKIDTEAKLGITNIFCFFIINSQINDTKEYLWNVADQTDNLMFLPFSWVFYFRSIRSTRLLDFGEQAKQIYFVITHQNFEHLNWYVICIYRFSNVRYFYRTVYLIQSC